MISREGKRIRVRFYRKSETVINEMKALLLFYFVIILIALSVIEGGKYIQSRKLGRQILLKY